MAAYIRIPESNATRNENELRSAIDQITRAYRLLQQIESKQLQMGTDAELAVEYNLTDVQDAADMRSLLASAVGELDAAPFFQQLISRLG